jgi:cell division septum initiation protein DivIVA
MKVLELLDEILAEIEESRKSLFSNKKMIEVDFVLEILQEIKDALPEDIEAAQKIIENRNKIIDEAQNKAHNVLKGVDSKINGMTDEHRVTQLAYEKANRLVDAAERQAYELRIGRERLCSKRTGRPCIIYAGVYGYNIRKQI